MTRFRWTKKELAEVSDLDFLRTLCVERKSTCTNVYSPLYKKITEIEARLEAKIAEEKAEAEKPEDTNKHVRILSHDISYFLRDTDLGIDKCGEEHITELIVDGYIEGELNIIDPENPEEVYYGYWHIVKDN